MEAGVVTQPDDERSFLERSLADLDAEHAAGDLSDADHAELRARYEARLNGSRHGRGAEPQRSDAENGGGRRARTWLIAAIVVAVVGVGGGLGVARWSGSRDPGENVSGSTPETSAQQLAKAASLAGQGKILDALKTYDAVLAENPRDVQALTYKGWLLRNVGIESKEPALAKQGRVYLQQATDIDPTAAEAWLFRGIIYYRDDGDAAKATQALKNALASNPIPEVATAARELLAEIQQSS
jgi:tetratricopeptide (TPR) repeat protein